MLATCGAAAGHLKLPGAFLPVTRDRPGCAAAGALLPFVARDKCSWWWRTGGEAAPRSVSARARLSSFFSSRIGLDSQAFESHDTSQLLWIGPVPGDIAEVEAYCRIFRAAEHLHAAIMDTLCNPETGECAVNYDVHPEDMPLLEEKVVAVLGCMLALLNRGREEVLSGRSSVMGSFQMKEVNVMDGKLPPLALFRDEMKKCCESLQVALTNYLMSFDDSRAEIWRRMQRLKNVCYDAGFSRGDGCPCPTIFANWSPVCFSTMKNDKVPENSEVAFWRGGQVTVEGLSWLLEKGFKTIVDMREEAVVDEYYNTALVEAISQGKIEIINLPVETGTAPSMEQVEKFASLVSNHAKWPIYLHSKEGVGRTSAMVSRWRQYITGSTVQSASGYSHNQNGRSTRNTMNEKSRSTLDFTQTTNGTVNFSENIILGSSSEEVCDLNEVHDNQILGAVEFKEQHDNKTSELSSLAHETHDANAELSLNLQIESDPMKAQFPVCNIFSRKEMNHFFRSKKIYPKDYLNSQKKKKTIVCFRKETKNTHSEQ